MLRVTCCRLHGTDYSPSLLCAIFLSLCCSLFSLILSFLSSRLILEAGGGVVFLVGGALVTWLWPDVPTLPATTGSEFICTKIRTKCKVSYKIMKKSLKDSLHSLSCSLPHSHSLSLSLSHTHTHTLTLGWLSMKTCLRVVPITASGPSSGTSSASVCSVAVTISPRVSLRPTNTSGRTVLTSSCWGMTQAKEGRWASSVMRTWSSRDSRRLRRRGRIWALSESKNTQ